MECDSRAASQELQAAPLRPLTVGPPASGLVDDGAQTRYPGEREAGLRFCRVPERSGEESAERRLRRQAELGRLLAAAAGYRVVASDGAHLGWLDHVRYERHADHPDRIVVRRRGLFPKRRALPFDAVEAVKPRERTVVLRPEGRRA